MLKEKESGDCYNDEASGISQNPRAENIPKNFWGTQNINDFISGLLQFMIFLYWPSLPKDLLFWLWCVMIIPDPELRDHRFALRGSTRVSVTWFQILTSIKLMCFETINLFSFSCFSLLYKQSPPSSGAKQIARFWAKFLEIMVLTSLLTSLIRELKVMSLPPLGRTDTSKEMR